MARSNSKGRMPTVGEFADIWRKLLAAADKALDGETDADGVHHAPTAAVLEFCRKLISDANLSPSEDVAEAARAMRDRLPYGGFPEYDEFGVPKQ